MPPSLKILIAPSAYKGSHNAEQIASAISQGLTKEIPDAQVESLPLADGGDGTIAAVHASLGGLIIETVLSETSAQWLLLPDKIIIELAQCCGLAKLSGALNPLHSHTYSLGEVLSNCLDEPIKEIIIGLGGSASTDGGTGALSALGVKFLDKNKNILPFGGGFLEHLHSIDLSKIDKRLETKKLIILADVTAPLLGPTGAAYVFAPQKGATVDQVKILESGLTRLAEIVQNTIKNDLSNVTGAGAAGGTAFGLASILKAKILPGFNTIANLIELKSKIENADLVITAEGKLDNQSLNGKATGELAEMCKILNKPLFVLPALLQDHIDWQGSGITAVYTTCGKNNEAGLKDIMLTAQKLATDHLTQ